jgi:hypothetical protein
MLRWRFTLLCLILTNFSFNLLAQSSSQSVTLTQNPQRLQVTMPVGWSGVRLEGLTAGQTYSVVANPMWPDDQAVAYEVKLKLSAQDLVSEAMSPEARPNRRFFEATESSMELLVQVTLPVGGTAAKVPSVLSVRCESCPDDNRWIEQFTQDMAVLSTTGGTSASSLVSNTLIGGNCFDVTNITSFGPAASRGTFNNGATNIGINTGVVLCTGNVNILPGPNTMGNTSGNTAGFNVNTPDDPDLATLTGNNQWDVTRIEFDFRPTSDVVQFEFVFASEEYCEFAGSNFNDVFGFFISGAGITGNQNIALIPSTTTPVAINNVNHFTNQTYYVNNNTFSNCGGLPAQSPAEVSMDGFTTVFTATATVVPCSTYHIKLALADVQDGLYASAVFLKAGSFNAGGVVKAQPIYPPGGQYVYENCGQAYIRFTRGSGDINVDLPVNFTISPNSTATPGDDYAPISGPFIIPAGQMFIDIPITVFSDLIVEADETIILLLDTPCSCTQSEMTFVIRDRPPLELVMDDQELCGGTSATLSPALTGGQAPFTYQWSTNATTSSISITTPGTNTYSVTVTDACGSTSVEEAVVTLLPTPTAAISGSGILCEGANGTFNLTVTMTGTGPWEVGWQGGGGSGTETFQTSPGTIVVTEPGTYTLTSVEAGPCTGTLSGSAVITEVDVNVTLNPTDPTCFGLSNGSITSSASGGTAPYTYAWSPSGSTPNLTNLAAGTYEVTVTSGAGGCTETASVTLDQPDLLTATLTAPNIDCNNPVSSTELEVNGGTPNYTYAWTGGLSGSSPNITMGGTYTVTVTDAGPCTTVTSVTIAANLTLPTAVATVTGQINCTTSEITINGNGSSVGPQFEYEWSGPSITAGETTLTPTVDAPGTYVLTVTNTENGCTRTVSVSVTQNITPPNAVIANPPNIGCNLPSFALNGNGSSSGPNFPFVWSTQDGNFVSGTNTLSPTINQAGTYTLVITNTTNGCTDEASVTVSGDIIPPIAVADPPATITCDDPTIQIDGSGSSSGGGYNYQWAGPPGGINSGGNTLTPTVDVGGTYTLTVTDASNSCTATVTVTVPINNTLPTAAAVAVGTITCQTPSIILNGNGSSSGPQFTYEWGTTNGNIVVGETTLNPEVNQGGTYILTVTNTENGCTRTASVTVPSNNSVPIANAGPPRTLNCLFPTISINASGSTGSNFSYQWTTQDGNIVSGATTLNPTINEPGCYTLVVTNNTNNCTAEDVVCIDENFDTPEAIIAPPIQIDCNNPTIDLDASASTQPPGITYQWVGPPGGINSGGNSDSPTVDLPGTYTITITNTESGCTDVASIAVTRDIVPPVAEAGPGGVLSCTVPTFNLNGTGSSTGPQFEYEWGTTNGNFVSGEFTLFPTIDDPGTYRLTVTNTNNGCTSTDAVTITADQNAPNANAGPERQLNCNNLSINLAGSASPSGMQIQWSTDDGNIVSGANGLLPVVNQEGTYTIVVTNPANGCTDVDEVFVENNISYPEALIADPGQLDCNNPTLDLDATASDPGFNGAGLIYQWTGPSGGINSGGSGPSPVIDQPGTYTLVVRNNTSQCTDVATVIVGIDIAPPTAVATPLGTLTCQFPTVEVSGNGSSSNWPFFYEWSGPGIVGGQYTLDLIVNQIGAYTLTVSNLENGCTRTAVANVITNQVFPTAIAGPPQTLTCTNPSLSLNGGGSSTGNQYAYVWATQNGFIVSGENTLTPVVNQPGTYELSVVNTQTGCTSVATVLVNLNQTNPAAVTAPGGTLSCTTPTLDLSGSGSSVGANFSYQWNTPNGNITAGNTTLTPTVNAVGAYTLVVTNGTNGCTSSSTTNVQADASLPTAAAGVPDTLTCAVSSLVLNGNASSQGNNFTYAWTGPGIVGSPSVLTPTVNAVGTYELLVTNTTNGCTAISAVSIAEDRVFPTVDAGPTATINCYNPTLTLSATATATGAQPTYTWTTPTGTITSGGNTLTPTISAPGTYNLLVLNGLNGCQTADVVVIDQNNSVPTAEAGGPGLIDCQHPTVTLTGSGTSANSAATYAWTSPDGGNIASGSTTPSPVVDAPGTYVLTVLDTINGCTATDQVLVTRDANVPIAAATAPSDLTCVIDEIQLDGTTSTAGLQYTWTTVGGNFVSGQNTLTPVVNRAGAYTLSVFNPANNCLALSTINVAIDTVSPDADAGIPAVISCLNPILTLTGSTNLNPSEATYAWTTQGGNFVNGQTTLTPQIDQSGFYILEITNVATGCTTDATVQILLDQNTPEADAGPTQLLTCDVVALALDGSASSQGPLFNYLWSGPSIVSDETTLAPVIDGPGTYNLLVSNPNNGCTATAEVLVTEDVLPPVVTLATPALLNCQLTADTLDASASVAGLQPEFAWTTSTGSITSGIATAQPVVDAPGTYVVTVTNGLTGCTSTGQIMVSEDIATPVVDAGANAQLNCTVPTSVLAATASNTGPNFQINWTTTGTGSIVSGANTLSPTINAPGTYTLVVSNVDNFCSATDQVVITQNVNAPTAVAAPPATLTCAVTDINLSGSGSSSGSNFAYEWTGPGIVSGGTTLTPNVNEPGLYTLEVTNTANNCVAQTSVTVPENIAAPTAVGGAPVTLTCALTSIGLNGTGSSTGSNFGYQWSVPAGSNGNIVSGSTTLTPTVNSPGAYNLLVTNNLNGCTTTATATVLQDVNAPTAAASTPGELTCAVTSLNLSGAGSSVGSQFLYLWTTQNGQISNGPTTLAPTVTEPGTYLLEVTNTSNNCKTLATINVAEDTEPPMVQAGSDDRLTCAITSLQLVGSASTDNTLGLTVAWSGPGIVSGGLTYTPTINQTGTYTLTVVDVYNGCTQSDAVLITPDVTAPAAAIATPDLLTCVVENVVLNAAASSQGTDFAYLWTGPGLVNGNTVLSPTVNQPGQYTLTINNLDNGCVSTTSVSVPQDIALPTAEANEGFELTCSVLEDELSAAGSSSGPNFTYAWSTPNGNIVANPNSAQPTVDAPGQYSLLVTNTATGCIQTDAATVVINTNYPAALELSTVLPKCGGQGGTIDFVEVEGGVGPFLYSIDGGDNFLTANAFGDLTPGTYDLVVQDANGCEYGEELTFPVPVEPTVDATPSISLDFGESATLVATLNIPYYQVDTIIWSPAYGITPTNRFNEVIAQPFQTTQYEVIVINNDGCQDRALVLVEVGQPAIYVPNVITSVSTSGNDIFYISSKEGTIRNIRTLQIYDRWGGKVFFTHDVQPNDPTKGWDGFLGGVKMNPAVFVWWAEVELASGEVILLEGDVTLID